MNEYIIEARTADASLPQKSQFLRPMANGLIAFSSPLLSMLAIQALFPIPSFF